MFENIFKISKEFLFKVILKSSLKQYKTFWHIFLLFFKRKRVKYGRPGYRSDFGIDISFSFLKKFFFFDKQITYRIIIYIKKSNHVTTCFSPLLRYHVLNLAQKLNFDSFFWKIVWHYPKLTQNRLWIVYFWTTTPANIISFWPNWILKKETLFFIYNNFYKIPYY